MKERIGRYAIREQIGQGGMGRVYLADDEALDRKVAIKVLREDLVAPSDVREHLLERMRREARAAAALSHPHIVTLHDMGEDPEVGLYLVFELIAGLTLRERISKLGPLPKAEVGKLATELASALDHAHAEGILHRDIKPENVMLSEFGAKITDFGIARLPDSTLTGPGIALGTLAYSAPEAMALGDFSLQSDQFSLAATVFEALTGRRVFGGGDAMAVASSLARCEIPKLAPLLPECMGHGELDEVFARAMSRSKDDRYKNCGDFASALSSGLLALSAMETRVPLPVPAPLPAVVKAAPRSVRRGHNVLIGGALLVIIVLALLGRRNSDGGFFRRIADAMGSASADASAQPARPPPKREPRSIPPRYVTPPAPSASVAGSLAPALSATTSGSSGRDE